MQTNEFDFRFHCGYSKPVAHMDIADRDEFIRAIWLHYVLFQPYAELQQFQQGLKDTLQLDLLFALYPHDMWSLFASTNAYDVTVDYLLDSFLIQYSDQGSNNRALEESIVYMWSQYITECEGIFANVMCGCVNGSEMSYNCFLQEMASLPCQIFFSSLLEPISYQPLGLINLLLSSSQINVACQ